MATGDDAETERWSVGSITPEQAADLEARLAADGVQIVEPKEVDLAEVYRSIRAAHAQRDAIARLAEAELAVVKTGVALPIRHFTFNFWRDKRGRLLSPEDEFVSVASAFYAATNTQIAAVLWPSRTITDQDLNTVEQKRRKLHRNRILVAFNGNR